MTSVDVVGISLHWSRRLIGVRKPTTDGERVSDWRVSLTDRQERAYSDYIAAVDKLRAHRLVRVQQLLNEDPATALILAAGDAQGGDGGAVEATVDGEQTLSAEVRQAAEASRTTLPTLKRRVFDATVVPFHEGPRQPPRQDQLERALVLRAILQRVFDLGWTPEHFAEFDSYVSRTRFGPDRATGERIGKKYQWIAYHEILARVSDRFAYSARHREDADEGYDGPWQIGRRDIDPSILVAQPETDDPSTTDDPWWVPCVYSGWEHSDGPAAWVQQLDDVPPLAEVLDITGPDDGQRWVPLHAYREWVEPVSPADDPYEMARRRLTLLVQAYVVRADHGEAIRAWSVSQDPEKWVMPDTSDHRNIFLGEYPWANAAHHGHPPSTEWELEEYSGIPHPLLPATGSYLFTDERDCSRSAERIDMPSAWLYRHLGLTHASDAGAFCNQRGAVVIMDPSVGKIAPHAVLADAEMVQEFSASGDYDLLWEVRWIKEVLTGSDHTVHHGRLDLRGTYHLDESGNFVGGANWTHTPARRQEEWNRPDLSSDEEE